MFAKIFSAAAVIVAFGAVPAVATQIGTLGTLTQPFFPGLGNSNTNFIMDSADVENIEIGIKAKERFVGELLFDDMAYQATAGESAPGLATWNVDFSIDLDTGTLDDFAVLLFLDFDSSINSTPASFELNANPNFAGLSLIQGSQNLGFPFFQLLGNPNVQPFDPFATGEYEIGIQVFNLTDELLAEVRTTVNVSAVSAVPLPATLPLLAFGLSGLFFVARRRQSRA